LGWYPGKKERILDEEEAMSDFWKGLLSTAVPLVILSIVATIGNVNSRGWASPLWAAVWIALLLAFVAAIVFAVKGKRRVSAGIFVGLAVAVVALGSSCFVLLSSGSLFQ
jgi:hypothetical protein